MQQKKNSFKKKKNIFFRVRLENRSLYVLLLHTITLHTIPSDMDHYHRLATDEIYQTYRRFVSRLPQTQESSLLPRGHSASHRRNRKPIPHHSILPLRPAAAKRGQPIRQRFWNQSASNNRRLVGDAPSNHLFAAIIPFFLRRLDG